MLEIFKAENPFVTKFIAEKLDQIDGVVVDTAMKAMLIQLASSPDETCIVVAFDDEELKGFIYGYLVDDWGFIKYAWGDLTLDQIYKKEVLDKFCDWAETKGKNEVRMETTRTQVKAWEKSYGMKPYSIVMRKELSDG